MWWGDVHASAAAGVLAFFAYGVLEVFEDFGERDVGEEGADVLFGYEAVVVEIEELEDKFHVVVEISIEESQRPIDEF
jgi:hypothetical protein